MRNTTIMRTRRRLGLGLDMRLRAWARCLDVNEWFVYAVAASVLLIVNVSWYI